MLHPMNMDGRARIGQRLAGCASKHRSERDDPMIRIGRATHPDRSLPDSESDVLLAEGWAMSKSEVLRRIVNAAARVEELAE